MTFVIVENDDVVTSHLMPLDWKEDASMCLWYQVACPNCCDALYCSIECRYSILMSSFMGMVMEMKPKMWNGHSGTSIED